MADENKNQKKEEQHDPVAEARAGNPNQPQEQNYVEDEEGNRAMATEPSAHGLDALPDGDDYTGLLEHQVKPYPDEVERDRQQLENYPRLPEEYFDPHGVDAREEHVPKGAAGVAKGSLRGRMVVVDHDVIHEGEVVKAGVQDLPAEVAEALIADGAAFEPAGKKHGR